MHFFELIVPSKLTMAFFDQPVQLQYSILDSPHDYKTVFYSRTVLFHSYTCTMIRPFWFRLFENLESNNTFLPPNYHWPYRFLGCRVNFSYSCDGIWIFFVHTIKWHQTSYWSWIYIRPLEKYPVFQRLWREWIGFPFLSLCISVWLMRRGRWALLCGVFVKINF